MKVLSTKITNKIVNAQAEALRLDYTCLDFIEVVYVEYAPEAYPWEQYDTIIFTSSNAVEGYIQSREQAELLRTKQIASLAGITRETLLSYGIEPILTASNSAQLAEDLIAKNNARSVLHPCGNLALDTLQNTLVSRGIRYTPLIVYNTILNPVQLRKNYDFILFYSPSGVESFFFHNKLSPSTVCCCIGTTTAAALKEKDAEAKILIPEETNPAAMLNIVSQYIANTTKA